MTPKRVVEPSLLGFGEIKIKKVSVPIQTAAHEVKIQMIENAMIIRVF